MKIILRQEHGFIQKALQSETYQAPFLENFWCKYCECLVAKPMLVINDDEGLISLQTEFVRKAGEIWPHDCLAIVLYMCPECGEITALWNQG